MKDEHVGTAVLPVSTITDELLHDVWVTLKHAVRTETTAYEEVCGSVHFLVQRTYTPSTSIFQAFGVPVPSLPIRISVGDTILFRSSNIVSHTTKLATRSKWDHAAIVVKLPGKKGLSLFEATRVGVKLYPLSLRLEFYLETTKLGVRKLYVTRTEEILDELMEFVREVNGRPYNFNPLDMGKALIAGNSKEKLSNIFCSQLVALAYQRMGLLSTKVSANNYLPSDLASSTFVLQRGILGPLQVLPKTHNVKHK